MMAQNSILGDFSVKFESDQIIFQITRQKQTNSLKDGQMHEESCLDLVFVDDVKWLNGGLQEKHRRRLKVLSNSTLPIVFGKRRQECSTLELHSLANTLTPS
jgi:hypothetical protein